MFHGRFLARGAALAGVLTVLIAGGCDEDPPANPAQFVGTWKITAGQLRPMCTGITIPPVSLVDEMIVVSPGTDSPLIALQRNCTLKLDIAGNTATARPGQSCDTSVPVTGVTVALKLGVASASFVVVDQTATFNQAGTGTLISNIPLIPAGTGCPYDITASATKTP